jgi:ribonucleoside-diphosphate reductase alpha chain
MRADFLKIYLPPINLYNYPDRRKKIMELPSIYQSIIHRSRYSRFIPEEFRRESWEETVDRLINYLKTKGSFDNQDGWTEYEALLEELKESILKLEVMPSMRLLMTAGEACERDNISAYNCSYLAINNKRAFSEALYILMNGTGVGFSCERQEISKLPVIPESFKEVEDVIVVGDSKLGWAKAFKKLLSSLWEGDIPRVDYSRVRPAGARLKTFGGRASGPEPLKRLFDFVIESFKEAKGRKLNSLEVHDIMCMIGEIVVVGGVRRSALISLSNLTDRRMREAKMGAWYNDNPHRGLANNSVAYTEKPDSETFMEEWLSLVKSKSGERGIFNRVAAQDQAAKWGRRDRTLSYGTNPCSEIILRDKQFCNLTEVVVRAEDTFDTLARKVRLATILGTIQSTLTNFNFLSEEWKANTEEERLLGVSLTGIMDNSLLNGSTVLPQTLAEILEKLRDIARKTNEEFAERLGITPSTSITCVKPSGTVSQLVDSASGIHARHSDFYIRRIRMDKKDPIYHFLRSKGVVVEDEAFRPDSTAVFSFPMKAPEGAVLRNTYSAIEQLELWLTYQRHWCEHKPSVTISVKDEEWPEVGAWVWKHFDEISGVSFLPYSNHSYVQAPYEDCTEEEYNELLAKTPQDINWEEFFENEDNTEGAQTLACTGNSCEIA